MWEHAQFASRGSKESRYWAWSWCGGRLKVGVADFLEKEVFLLPEQIPLGQEGWGLSYPGSAAGPPGHPLWQTVSWGSG